MAKFKLSTDVSRVLGIGLLIIVISVFHYSTPTHFHYLHEIYRALFFLPIILAAFLFQLRGGIISAVVVIVIYLPHVVFQWGGDLFYNFSRFVQMIVYLIIGVVSGLLAQRERYERDKYQKTAEELDESYRKLKLQSMKMAEIEDKLRDSERLSILGELAASLAHEVRNPLGSIWGVMEIIRDDFEKMGKSNEFIEVLFKEVNRLNQVVENYLNLARKTTVVRQPCNIPEVARAVAFLLNYRLQKQKISLEINFPPKPFIVMANESQIQQIFFNTILNSIAALPEGGKIEVRGELLENGRKKVSIIDNGEGFDDETRKKIFKPFFTTKNDGTGLGLSIIKRIAEENHWTIEINSQKGIGTTISIYFNE